MSSDDDEPVVIEHTLNYKSISCENIPELFLDKLTAKKHFGKFGKINRFILRPKRLSCTVEYEREEDAENALDNAGNFNGHEFEIKFTTQEVAHTRNTEEWVDPDVQAELDAMGNPMRMQQRTPSLKYLTPKMPKPILKSKPMETLPRVEGNVNAKNELEAILRRKAFDTEDRYRILDARDKLLRLTTVRTTDIKKAQSIKGFCPDMCPEKERLMRIAKHQVSPFEVQEGTRNTMDHKTAIKEYSRSSADQDAPLAHDLRPESVLNMTMTYLLHKVMNLCDNPETSIGDWYHFVWDRTRSIRKDITQQELCSLGAVRLVEQCTRFHIHCAARLVAEESSIFDQRINTENLTKCLQTLKYMYHDLGLKKVKCPNEAEFRAYVVLLNLSDSNFWWEVKHLPEEIQNSKEIRSAVGIYLSMESNNYVKFFKLVKETTYMSACILLRYFTQVRLKAMMTILKAYNWPRQTVSLPLKYLTEILAFESDDTAIAFFNHYGLECDSERVMLDRNAFYVPDMPPPMDRSLTFVEAKRTVSVGEVICGENLAPVEVFENHEPHCSFTDDGFLKPESWNAEDQMPGTADKKIKTKDPDSNLFKVPMISPPISPKIQNKSVLGIKLSPEPIKISPAPPVFGLKPPTNIDNTPTLSSNGTVGSLFSPKPDPTPVIGNSIFSSFSFSKPKEQSISKPNTSIFGGTASQPNTNIFGASSFQPTTPNLSPGIFKSDSVFKNFDMKPPPKSVFGQGTVQLKTPPSLPITEPVKIDVRSAESGEIVGNETEDLEDDDEEDEQVEDQENYDETAYLKQMEEEERELKEEERRQQIEDISERAENILDELEEEVYEDLIEKIASEEMNIWQNFDTTARQLTDDIITEYLEQFLTEVVNEESSVLTKNQTILKKYIQMWKENVRRRLERKKLMESTPIWLLDETIEETAESFVHQYQNETLDMMRRYRLGIPTVFNLEDHPSELIDLISILAKEFEGQKLPQNYGVLKSRKYFKIILSLPQENEEQSGFYSYINNWLDKILNWPNNEAKKFICSSQGNLALCLRKVSGQIPKNEENIKVSKECDHSDAMVFIMTTANLFNSRRRLHHILKLSRIYKTIPVAVIVYKNSHVHEDIETELQLEKLVKDNKISSYSIIESNHKFTDGLRTSLVQGFQFVAQSYVENAELEMQNFVSFLKISIGDELWMRLYECWMINPSFRKVCTKPEIVVDIYNNAIDRLVTLVDEDLDECPEFPEELYEFVPKLNYDIPMGVEYFPKNWKDNQENIKIKLFLKKLKLKPFNNKIKKEIPKIEQTILDFAIDCIPQTKTIAYKFGFSAIKSFLERLNSPDLLDLPVSDRLNLISWLTIIKPIALGLLTTLWEKESKDLPSFVIYKKATLENFLTTAWWLESRVLKEIKIKQCDDSDENSFKQPEAKKMKIDSVDFDLDAILAKGNALVQKAENNIEKFRKLSATSNEISRSFDMSLYTQEMIVRNARRYIQDNL